jgi:hypothetical protein
MRYLEWSNSYRQKVSKRLPGLGGGGDEGLSSKSHGVSVLDDENCSGNSSDGCTVS